ncbi:class I SAM-dependent methyltransferase [Paenibacillus elgii]|uniref:class I SAM-dependent methyltransferase n=1 Tax=Paenibacillus elgii TaxID=189691 RepID=UPI0013CFB4FB
MDWEYHPVRFAADHAPELPLTYMTNGAWSGHRRFAYDLVRFAKPRLIAELGTLYGTSFFSFCQAVKDGNLPARCFAVDTWQGDMHTGYYGGDPIYEAVQSVTLREFPGIGYLVRSHFDQALAGFPDGSVDLLHIDGYHTYDAVLHDYTTWYPKLAENGIVLFHDIVVRLGDFGVYRLWEKLSGGHPSLQFPHSNGLGVLFPKGCPPAFQALLAHKDELVAHYIDRA